MESKKSGMTLFDFGFKTSRQQAESTLRDEDDVFQEEVAGEGKVKNYRRMVKVETLKQRTEQKTETNNVYLTGLMISKVRLLLRSNQIQSQALRQMMWK